MRLFHQGDDLGQKFDEGLVRFRANSKHTFRKFQLSILWQVKEGFNKVAIDDAVQHVLASLKFRACCRCLFHHTEITSLLLHQV